MLDGLASVSQAALHLGHFDVIAFENDKRIWEEAGKVVASEIEKLKGKDKSFRAKIAKSLHEQQLAASVMDLSKEKKEKLDEQEV